jgi:ketosteroid isomerase-like protein
VTPAPHADLVAELHQAVVDHGWEVTIERYDDWFAPDFEWHPVLLASLDGRAFRGKEDWKLYWQEFSETFADVEFVGGGTEPIDDRRVLAFGEVKGSGAASGAPIDREVAYVFEVEDGLIIRGRSFFSPADAKEYIAHA